VKRWAWNLFCLVSLLVFVSSVTIWVRSYFVGDYVTYWSSATASCNIVCRRAALRLEYIRYDDWMGSLRRERNWFYSTFPPQLEPLQIPKADWSVDFKIASIHLSQGSRTMRALIFPLWLFLPAGVPPFLWWRKWRTKGGRGARGFPVSVAGEKPMQ